MPVFGFSDDVGDDEDSGDIAGGKNGIATCFDTTTRMLGNVLLGLRTAIMRWQHQQATPGLRYSRYLKRQNECHVPWIGCSDAIPVASCRMPRKPALVIETHAQLERSILDCKKVCLLKRSLVFGFCILTESRQ
jgi:hypothetical protein